MNNTMQIILALYVLYSCSTIAFCGTHPDGASEVSREQDALGNYKFSYAIRNPEGEHFRKEGTDHLGRVIGSYGLTHVDGTHRVVDYVADKDGFRAEIRSNEPGVASSESADTSIVKTHSDFPLTAAASSVENSGASYGARLKADSSRVSYAEQKDEKSPKQEDNLPRESRQRTYEDYRPRNPVAYYPSGALDTARPVSQPAYSPANVPVRSQSQNPSGESRSSDIYLPPIDPNSARRPYFIPRERMPDRSVYSTTSRRPFLPPYGGFDDDPAPVDRRPGISMSTIHGGLGRDEFESPRSATPSYGAGRYPSDDEPLSRGFLNPHFPQRSNYPPLPPSIQSPRIEPGVLFRPPSYDSRLSPPNFVLRAVPIPNGIQAVRVDPETGRVYDRLIYPLYIRDGQTIYDRNVLLHNDDVSDDGLIRNQDPDYLDIPFRRRPPFRSIRNPTLDLDEDFGNATRRFNRSFDPLALSIPTARDLDWVQRQLQRVEGFDRARFPDTPAFQNSQLGDNEYPLFNDFDDSSNDESPDTEDGPYSRIRNSGRSSSLFSRNPRVFERLTPEDTKDIASRSDSLVVDVKPSETDPKPSVIEKE